MKLKDLLTSKDKLALLTFNGEGVGIMPQTILTTDIYYSLSNTISQSIYVGCGNRNTSAIYDRIYEFCQESYAGQPEEKIVEAANYVMGEHLRSKFNNKWTRLYNAIYNDYEVLVTDNYTETRVYKDSEVGTNKNNKTTTYGMTVDSNSKENVDQTTTRTSSVENDRYGFNSDTSVGDTTSTDTTTDRTTQNADSNTVQTNETRGGQDSEVDDNNNTKNTDGTETINKKGLNGTPSETLTKELQYRLKYDFIDIVVSDIINTFTNQIY